jgi:hypothetical protein
MAGMPHHDHELATWQRLLEPAQQALVDAASEADASQVQDVARLRKRWSADLVGCALELAAARRRAQPKFPDAYRLVADLQGVEQATDHVVATYKAQRFRGANASSVLDLCCGIGGDAMALHDVCNVLAVDRSPLRAWMTQRNVHCAVQTGDVCAVDVADRFVHCDPARRDETNAQRAWRLDAYEPGPAFLAHVMNHAQGGCLKLGPGLDRDALGADTPMEFEYISHRGRLVQLAVWFGVLADPGLTRATLLPDEITIATDAFAPPPSRRRPGSIWRWPMRRWSGPAPCMNSACRTNWPNWRQAWAS